MLIQPCLSHLHLCMLSKVVICGLMVTGKTANSGDGGAGFIGSHLVDRLMESGNNEVYCFI